MTFDTLVARFRGPARHNTDGSGLVFCSVHEDGQKHGRQSLHLTPGDDQHLVHCFAGCPTTWVLGRVGLSLADLFVRDEDRAARPAPMADSSPLPDYEAIWARAQVGSDRLARYLRARGLSGAVPAALRLAPHHPYYDHGRQVGAFDTMLARVQTLDGRTVALHQTYLSGTDDGKARVEPARKLTRTEPGATIGAAIRLAEPTETLGLAEGVETALAVTEAIGTPMWATVSAAGLQAVVVPETVRRVEIWADHDAAGQRAAQTAAARVHRDGREVVVLLPAPPGADWRDVLEAHGAIALADALIRARSWAPAVPPAEPGPAADLGNEAPRSDEPRLLPDPAREPLEGNAPILLDHLRYVVGVSVRLTPGGTVSIRPKAKLTAELRSALAGCLGDLRALLEAERQPVAREAGDIRPVLPGKVGDLKLDGAAAWQVLEQANVPPWLFRRFGTLVTIERDEDDRPIAKLLDVPRLAHQLASRAYFTVTRWVGDTPTEMPAPPPTVLVKDLLATPDPPAPMLLQIVGAPIVTPSGRLHEQPGYDPESRTLYVPAPGFVLPPVPPSPTDDEIQAAVKTLLEPFLDFPFVAETDRTHALAALFTILARPLIPGPAPLFLFDKPRQGTGATLLATVIGLIATGQEPPVMAQGDDDAEWRKRLVAALLRAPAVVLLDNLTGDLDTPALSMILTTGYVLERLLGTMQDVTFKTTTVFLGTGNNVTLVGDMVRRHVPVRLDAKVEKPWMRARDGLVTFTHPKLLAWVTAQRGALLAAAFTVVQAWIARGRPAAAADPTLGSYERWAEVLGGLLTLAGCPGFLSTLDEAYESVDPEQDATKRFLRLWWTTHEARPQSASTLLPLASALTVALPLGGKDDAGRAMSLGRWLARHARQTADLAPDLSVRLVRLPSGAQGTLWQFDPMRRPDPTAMGLIGSFGTCPTTLTRERVLEQAGEPSGDMYESPGGRYIALEESQKTQKVPPHASDGPEFLDDARE